MTKRITSIFFTTAIISFNTASASVIDFDNVAIDSSTGSYLDSTLDILGFEENGFKFSSNMNIFDAHWFDSNDTNTTSVAYNDKWGEAIIKRTNGEAFSFSGLSLKYIQDSATPDAPTSMNVFLYKNNALIDTLNVTNMTDWSNVSGNFTDIDMLVIDTDNHQGNFIIDNLDVTANSISNNVPEPESLTLALLGFPLISWTARRKKSNI